MTQRSKADLDLLFADNATRDISPARLRDFLESCVPSLGTLHFADPGTPTIIGASSTFIKAENVSVLYATPNRFSMPANNRLQYDGPADGVSCLVLSTLAVQSANNNQVLAFAIAKNGVVEVPSIIRTKISTGTDVQSVALFAYVTLDAGDYVEVWAANDTSASDITINHGHLRALAFLT